jgi:hypothetical protein
MESEHDLVRREAGRLVSVPARGFGVHSLAPARDAVPDPFCGARGLEIRQLAGKLVPRGADGHTPKIDPARVDALQIAQLTRERDKLKIEFDKAKLVIAVQKKVAALLALLEQDNKPESNS